MTTLTSLTRNSATATTGPTTASITTTANRLALLAVSSREQFNFTTSAIPTVSGWTQVDTVEYDTDGSSHERITLFRLMGGSDATGTHTISFGSTSQAIVRWSIVETDADVDTTGTNGSGAIVQFVPNNGASTNTLTVTLAAFGSTDNATFGCFAFGGDGVAGTIDLTEGSGFTALDDLSGTGVLDCGLLTEYKTTNDTSVDCSNAITSLWCGGIAVEIKAAGGGAVTHPSTGALTAQSATVAGTAAHLTLHASTGALTAQSATVSGSATRISTHPSSGALTAQAAQVSGAAVRTRLHPTTGVLTAQAATLAGSAVRTRLHPSSGALVAQAATAAGDAAVTPAVGPKESTGALEAQSAVVSGAAEVIHIAPVFVYDGHDGGKEPKKRNPADFKQYREAKERLRKQIEAAFSDEEPEEVREVKKKAEVVLAQEVKKHDIAKAMETIRLLQEALEYAQDEEDLLNILL